MDDEQLADLHRFLAEHHRQLARDAVLDVVTNYHTDLAQRLREGEQRKKDELQG